MDWSDNPIADPWAEPMGKSRVDGPIVLPLPIVGTPLPKSPQDSISQREDYSGLTLDSSIDELLSAVANLKSLSDEAEKIKAGLVKATDVAREHIRRLEVSMRIAREVREEADKTVREFNVTLMLLNDELKRIRQLYTDKITRQRELEDASAEEEAFLRLAQKKPWGSKALPHQLAGSLQMVQQGRCILGDQMGLGKTLQAIMAMDYLAEQKDARRVLVCAPNDIIANFAREINYWSVDRNVLALGDYRTTASKISMLRLLIDAKADEFTLLLNYEAIRNKEIQDALIDLKIQIIILDEAHNLKDPKSQTTRAVDRIVKAENIPYECDWLDCRHNFVTWPWSRLCPKCQKPIEKKAFARQSVKYIFPMTGTAILNSPDELWKLLNFMDWEAFSSQRDYLFKYCRQIFMDSLTGNTRVKKWTFGWGGEKALFNAMGPKFIRRTRETAGIRIPPQGKQYHTLEFEDGKHLEQRAVMDAMRRYAQIVMSNADVLTAQNVLVLINRLRQIITMPSGVKIKDPVTGTVAKCPVTESIKVEYAQKLTNEFVFDNEERVVVFSNFIEPLVELAKRLEEDGISVALYASGTDQDTLDGYARDFDRKFTKPENAKYKVFLSTYKKGGSGINLTGATQTIKLDEEWNPGKNEQADDRTNRIGQTEETTVHVLRVAGTIDDAIGRLLDFKAGNTGEFNEIAEREALIKLLKNILED